MDQQQSTTMAPGAHAIASLSELTSLAAPSSALDSPTPAVPPHTHSSSFRTLRPSPDSAADDDTVLYLAYGSNLAAATFQGVRGIKPLAAVNVVVPALRLTFDLPGLPYLEPCFANSGPHNVRPAPPDRYHKNRWLKGLVGVVYKLTPADFAHVLATEGRGATYSDVLVDCFPLECCAPTVPDAPAGASFKAHTLFAKNGVGFVRPDTSYAQPSRRYLDLITSGAVEHRLPAEYQDYLAQIRAYRITTRMQAVGRVAFLVLWAPVLLLLFRVLAPLFARKDGTLPAWVVKLAGLASRSAWGSYDRVFYRLFGDGERSIPDHVVREQTWSAEEEKQRLMREEQARDAIVSAREQHTGLV